MTGVNYQNFANFVGIVYPYKGKSLHFYTFSMLKNSKLFKIKTNAFYLSLKETLLNHVQVKNMYVFYFSRIYLQLKALQPI